MKKLLILVISFCLVPVIGLGKGVEIEVSHTCPDGQAVEVTCDTSGVCWIEDRYYDGTMNGEYDFDAVCEGEGHSGSSSEEPEEPEEPQQPQTQTATNVPALANFDMVNTYAPNELNFTFTPKGSSLFQLNMNLKSVNGQDILSGWCTGDGSICKAVGNGKACSGEDYTGSNMWCYKAE